MKLVAFILAASLSSCGTMVATPQTPAQIVFAAKNAYNAALLIAVTYKELPSCTPPTHPVLCSDAAIVKSLQDKDDIAAPALDAAEKAVRAIGFDAGALQTLAVSAKAAVGVLTSVTDTLRIK